MHIEQNGVASPKPRPELRQMGEREKSSRPHRDTAAVERRKRMEYCWGGGAALRHRPSQSYRDARQVCRQRGGG